MDIESFRLPGEADSKMAKRLGIPNQTLRGILYFGARPNAKTKAKLQAGQPTNNTEMLSTGQAAALMGVSQALIRTWASTGLISHMRLPGRKRDLIRIPASECQRLLSETTIPQKTPTSKEENT
jgi:hypothetical protein